VLQWFKCAARGERKHVKIEESFACVHLKEVSIECEERLRVKDKVNQIVKILNRNGVLTEQIGFKKIPRPEACKLTSMFFRFYISPILKNIGPFSSYYTLRFNHSPSKVYNNLLQWHPYSGYVILYYELMEFRNQNGYISHQDKGATNSGIHIHGALVHIICTPSNWKWLSVS
jgi:hypothetical protein